MKGCKVQIIFQALLLLSLSFVTGDYRSKLKNHFTPLGISCFSDYSISFQDIEDLNNFKVPKGKEAACFFACILKKAKILDSDGLISVAGSVELGEKLFKNEEDLTMLVSVFQQCLSVNNKPVSDGKEGCERAKLLLICLQEQEEKAMSAPGGEAGRGSSAPEQPRNDDRTLFRGSRPSYDDSDREKPNPVRRLFRTVFSSAIQISCIPLDKDFITGRLLSFVFPRIELINALCASVLQGH